MASNSIPNLSLIIPCFNEEDTIGHTIGQVTSYLKEKWPNETYELFVVNDGSTDKTHEIALSEREKNSSIRVENLPYNQGRGAAIKKGLAVSMGQKVIVLDADLTYDVDHIGEILDQFNEDPGVDVVVVSPYMKGGIVKNVPFQRLIVSRMANWVLSSFFSGSLKTVTCVVRGYRGNLVRSIPFFESGKELHLEMLRKLDLRGAKMIEIPGRLIWKKQNSTPRRKNNLRMIRAAKRHFLYGLLIRPTHLLKFATIFLAIIALWEAVVIGIQVVNRFVPSDSFAQALWLALSFEFNKSPHSFFIGGIALILAFQGLMFVSLLEVMRLQQEESLQHLLAILDQKNRDPKNRGDSCAES